MSERNKKPRRGTRHMACVLVTGVAASLACVSATVASAAPEPAAADTSMIDTPTVEEVFNGFVIGALDSATAATDEEAFQALLADDPFYDEPTLTGHEAPGELLKVKPVDVMFLGTKPANIEAFKIMYVTTGLDALTPEISTGIVMIPVDGKATIDRKVISYQEANDSVGGYCHPSSQWTGGDPLDGSSWSALGPLALMFDKGYAVVISDVGNNGDRNPHGVFAGKFAGHAQLDAIRASLASEAIGLRDDAPISLFGVAGGGVGAGFAAESQPHYAPELNVQSAVLEGMVVNQRNFMRTADGSIGSGFALATLLGLEPKYPEMRIDDKLTNGGKVLADFFRTQCQTPAYFGTPFLPLSVLFKNGQSPADIPEFQHVFDDNLLGSASPDAKVLITSCAGDDSPMSLVPAQDSRVLAEKYRAGGTQVTYAPSDCSIERMVTNLYGWSTDLFGMQSIDWIDHNFTD